MSQPSLPFSALLPEEVESKLSWSAAIHLCAEKAGFDLDKQACAITGMDKARWSRIQSGNEGIKWTQLQAFMDTCANDAPLLWMLHQRGYDIRSLHKRATVHERRINELEEALARERQEREALERGLRRIMAGAAA